MRDDRRSAGIGERSATRILRNLDDITVGKRSGNETASAIVNIEAGISITVVSAQQLIEPIGVLAALGIFACDRDFRAGWVVTLAACRYGRFMVFDGDGEAAGIGIAGSIDSGAGDGGCADREYGVSGTVAEQLSYTAIEGRDNEAHGGAAETRRVGGDDVRRTNDRGRCGIDDRYDGAASIRGAMVISDDEADVVAAEGIGSGGHLGDNDGVAGIGIEGTSVNRS